MTTPDSSAPAGAGSTGPVVGDRVQVEIPGRVVDVAALEPAADGRPPVLGAVVELDPPSHITVGLAHLPAAGPSVVWVPLSSAVVLRRDPADLVADPEAAP